MADKQFHERPPFPLLAEMIGLGDFHAQLVGHLQTMLHRFMQAEAEDFPTVELFERAHHLLHRFMADVDAAFVMVATGDEIRPDTDAEVESLLALD